MKTGVEVQNAPSRASAKIDKPTVKMEGYMEKKGKLRVVSTWKRYWFALEGRLLLYYKSQQEYQRLSPCRGSLNMGLASCVRPRPGPTADRVDGHILEVVLRSHVVTLRAKDRITQEQWLKALLDSMALPTVNSPAKDTRIPLHFRYPSADNLSKSDQVISKETAAVTPPRKEKHRTLPNWKRTSSSEIEPEKGMRSDVPQGGAEDQRVFSRRPDAFPKGSPRSSGRSVHPAHSELCPFGNQRYSFHCLRKSQDEETLGGNHNKSVDNVDEHIHEKDEMGKKSLVNAKESKSCRCKGPGEDEKENILKMKRLRHTESDENQNRLIGDFVRDPKSRLLKHSPKEKYHSSSERDLLMASGIDLSMEFDEKGKLARCTSADELSSTKNFNSMNHLDLDIEYFSAVEIPKPHSEISKRSQSQEKKKRQPRMSLRQRLALGDGEYVRCSDLEDCDRTANTTADSWREDLKSKPKMRLKKRKELQDSNDTRDGAKKRAPVRNRLSFLSRVFSHVRLSRDSSVDSMDDADPHSVSDATRSTGTATNPHKDVVRTTSEVLSTDLENCLNGSAIPGGFPLGSSDPYPTEAPEEPPPDYDFVIDSPTQEEPPQLPPRRMKRPRSPWHDVPTNNSLVVDGGEAGQRLLSAAKYGRVVGTRPAQNMTMYDWGDSQNSDMAHHAYEVVSPDISPIGSNEHLAIYLSSESSDDEFHEEVVLRRNIQDNKFFSALENGQDKNVKMNDKNFMQPLSINTQDLPMLDSSGKVGLSHVEAMKLSLLMQAQKATHESAKLRRKEESNKLKNEVEENFRKLEDVFCKDVRTPPDEFADKEDLKTQNGSNMQDKILEPVEVLQKKSVKQSPKCDENVPETSISSTVNNQHTHWETSDSCDTRPVLPKKTRISERPSHLENNQQTDELNVLLTQLANMTTALLPVGVTDLQSSSQHNFDGVAKGVKQSSSLDAVAYDDSEPDYDVPRPHASLMRMLQPNHGRQQRTGVDEDDDIIVAATHFFSRPDSSHESNAAEPTWSGNISPDSLDIPGLTKRPHTWELSDTMQGCGNSSKGKQKAKKDRSRRATLSGPISQPVASVITHQTDSSRYFRRNSAELTASELVKMWEQGRGHLERRYTEPKQIEHFSSTCEHSGSAILKFIKEGKTPSSLEDISEGSELERLETPQINIDKRRKNFDPLKLEDLDFDSLEVTELKNGRIEKGEIILPPPLVSIVEEPDVISDKSSKSDEEAKVNGENSSSGSTSEKALICEGDSESKASDQKTSRATDTDMEMISDDELGNCLDCVSDKGEENASRMMELDSLINEQQNLRLSESFADCTDKDASIEADSLEIKR